MADQSLEKVNAGQSLEKVNAGALSSQNLSKSVPDVWVFPAVFENSQFEFIGKQADVYNIKTPQPIINQPPQNNKQIIKQYYVFQTPYLSPLGLSLHSSSALQLRKQTHCIGWGLSAEVQRLKFNESLDVLLSSDDGQPVRVGIQFQKQVQVHCHALTQTAHWAVQPPATCY